MYNIFREHRRWKLVSAILSLSLLTVMAGAAVAPALSLIQEYFSGVDKSIIQMIISLPALFIAITNVFFTALSKRFKARTMLLMGLALYVVGGCAAGIFSNIILVLILRALVGVGVGIIMPLSTGLISFYFTKDKQPALMGYSSALNMMGGVVATLIAGALATISWRCSFLVYMLGLISVVLALLWMPNEKIYLERSVRRREDGKKENFDESIEGTRADAKKNKADAVNGGRGAVSISHFIPFVAGMFVLSFTFFVYPSSFAMETAKSGVLGTGFVAPVMAGMDMFGFAGGLLFPKIAKRSKLVARFLGPVSFLIAYALLGIKGGIIGTIAGSAFVGFAQGTGIPYIMTSVSLKAGRSAATVVMPWISAALYAGQFVTPFVLSLVSSIIPVAEISPYIIALCSSAILIVISLFENSRAESASSAKK